jgi:hypothetical protein
MLALGASLAGSSVLAEEQHALMTALSQTAITGYVDTSAIWSRGAPSEPILFQDNFDTDSSANWNVFAGAPSGVEDYTVDWAFDYSTNKYVSGGVTNTIPPAPNSTGTSRGVKLTVNHNDETAERAGVNIYPKEKIFTGDYALRFDMWINYNGPAGGGTGSTEHAIFGINHAGDKVNWHFASASDGIFFAVTGEGGAGTNPNSDYVSYEGDPGGAPLKFTDQDGGFLDRDGDGTFEEEVPGDSEFNLLFPTPPFETTGMPSKNWVQVEVRQVGTTVTWLINGYVIAEKASTLGWTSGNIMLGIMDVFNSIANPREDNFVIFDNVRVVNLTGAAVPSRLTLQSTAAAASEPSTHGAFTITRSGDLSSALTVNLRVRGTATAGQDYTAIPLMTNVPAGAATLEVPVSVINDARAESVETVILDLVANGTAYEVFAPMTGTVEITDDNDVTAINLAVANAFAYEGIPSDTAAFRVTRVGDTSGDLTVNYTLAGTGQAGTDYQNPGASVVIPAGASDALITIVPIDNTVSNENRTVTLTLASGTGYTLGTTINGTVTIRNDDDGVELGEVLFSDNFDTDTAAEWTVFEAHADNNRATFNYDYSTIGIPAAPNTTNSTTRGLKLEANIAAPTFTGLSVSPNGEAFEGDYRLSFDMWINYNGPLPAGGTGSTMSFSAGVGTSNNAAQFPGTAVDGVLFSVTGDGGSGTDWRAYVATGAPLGASSGAYAATGTELGVLNNTNVYYAPFGGVAAPEAQLALYPDQTGLVSIGAPGLAWHEVAIEKRGTNISWFVDNLRIATITLTNKPIGSNIFVGFFDINATQTGNQDLAFGLVDNIRVNALESSVPTGEINITGVVRSGSNIELTFTAPDSMQAFVVEGSATVDGDYAPEGNVQFATVSSAGGITTRRATIPVTTANRFFLVRQQ